MSNEIVDKFSNRKLQSRGYKDKLKASVNSVPTAFKNFSFVRLKQILFKSFNSLSIKHKAKSSNSCSKLKKYSVKGREIKQSFLMNLKE